MHEFIFKHDAYDVVIEKVVVGYHSLMRFSNLYSWPKNCGVCVVEGPCNVHKFLHTHIHLFVVKYNCVIKLSVWQNP